MECVDRRPSRPEGLEALPARPPRAYEDSARAAENRQKVENASPYSQTSHNGHDHDYEHDHGHDYYDDMAREHAAHLPPCPPTRGTSRPAVCVSWTAAGAGAEEHRRDKGNDRQNSRGLPPRRPDGREGALPPLHPPTSTGLIPAAATAAAATAATDAAADELAKETCALPPKPPTNHEKNSRKCCLF